MKKQFMTSVVCFALLVIMFMGSSIAWFTDEVSSANNIMVGTNSVAYSSNQAALGLDDAVVSNVLMPTETIYKDVTVINDGNQPSYVRTLFAFEDSEAVLETVEDKDWTALSYIQLGSPKGYEVVIPGVTNEEDKIQFTITRDGVETLYTVGYYQHEGPLSYEDNPEDELFYYNCLQSITLSGEAKNNWAEAVGDTYEYIVLTQSTQTGGFENAQEAFTLSFGEMTSENVAEWFGRTLKVTEGWEDAITSRYPVPVSEADSVEEPSDE